MRLKYPPRPVINMSGNTGRAVMSAVVGRGLPGLPGPAGPQEPLRFYASAYGATGDGTDQTAAIVLARNAANAAGGVVDFRMPFNSNPVYGISSEIEFGAKVDVLADGGNFLGDSGAVIRCLTNTARVVFKGRGGVSEGFTVDGNGTGDPTGILVTPAVNPVALGRTFRQIAAINSAGNGWVINSAQNCLFENCHGINNDGSNWIIDKGAGGLKFDRCGGSGHGAYGLLIQQTAGGVSPYPTAPSHIQFDHCIWECQNTDVTGVIRITAAGGIDFYSCGAAGNVTGNITSGIVVDVDASAGALNVRFDSPLITGKFGNTTYTLLRAEGLAQIVLTGHRKFYHGGIAHRSDSNLATFQDFGVATYGTAMTDWAEGTAGDLTSTYTPHTTPHAWQLPTIFTTAWSVKQKADAGIRAYVDSIGRYVITGDGSGFTTKGALGYNVTDDGVQLTGPFRIGAGFARTSATQTITVAGAVTIDAKASSHHKLIQQANITSMTVTGATDGKILRITRRQDATGGRTCVWPTNFRFGNNNTPPNTLTALRQDTFEMVYDANLALWQQTPAENVPTT